MTAWRVERQKTSLGLGGQGADLREVMNAILYVNHTGIPRRYLPRDFPPHTTVFSCFSSWTADGTIEKLGVHLRRTVREQVERPAEPTACVIDAQSVKTAHAVPSSTQGIDAGGQPPSSVGVRSRAAAACAASQTPPSAQPQPNSRTVLQAPWPK